jgi:hypothetical protein
VKSNPINAAWARNLESQVCAAVDEVRQQGDLARHHEEGGDLASCLRASLRAAELAEQLCAVREVAQHLQRAARPWPKVHGDNESRLESELLERVARASRRVGDAEPYVVDNGVDEAGNQNGVACAKPGKGVTGDDGQPFQLYNFIDDVVATR